MTPLMEDIGQAISLCSDEWIIIIVAFIYMN
jgi:hypothetical protein